MDGRLVKHRVLLLRMGVGSPRSMARGESEILWILTAMASDNLGIFLLVGCVQFVVAPYSLAVSFMTLGCWRRRDISRGEDVGRVGWNVGFGQMMCGEGWNRPKLA